MDALELWLVRHGETQWNKERRIQGNSDIPLNALGQQQAAQLAQRLKGLDFDQIYSSDLQRARQTAVAVFPEAQVTLDKRLREINLGKFEGRVWTDLTGLEQAELSVWHTGPFDRRIPGGESSNDLQTRVESWLRDLPGKGRVICFAHGGTLASLLHSVLGRPDPTKGTHWGFRLKNTSLSRLLISQDFVTVDLINDVAHLDE